MGASGVSPVDLGVTVCTPSVECLLESGRRGTRLREIGVAGVTLQAQERLLVGEQIGEHRAVGLVADRTIVSEIGMLESERADELSVAVDAETFYIHGLDIVGISRAVGIVAVRAQHDAVGYGVSGRKCKLGLDPFVTGKAQVVDLSSVSFLLCAFVELVTILTGYFGSGVGTFRPELDVAKGVGAVTLQAKQGLGACGKSSDGNELTGVAPTVFLDIVLCYGLAAGTVTALAVDKGHLCALDLLLSVDAFLQKGGILIVSVAGREAGLISHIIGKEGTDEHLLILPHGFDGPAGF